jgi:hypothetical protein
VSMSTPAPSRTNGSRAHAFCESSRTVLALLGFILSYAGAQTDVVWTSASRTARLLASEAVRSTGTDFVLRMLLSIENLTGSVNKGRLGPKGLNGWVANHAEDRLKYPVRCLVLECQANAKTRLPMTRR